MCQYSKAAALLAYVCIWTYFQFHRFESLFDTIQISVWKHHIVLKIWAQIILFRTNERLFFDRVKNRTEAKNEFQHSKRFYSSIVSLHSIYSSPNWDFLFWSTSELLSWQTISFNILRYFSLKVMYDDWM